MPGPDQPSLGRRLEAGRLMAGSLLELTIKAYGASAALSVALSDEETFAGKGRDALAAVPNLIERYRAAKYVAEHQQEIQAALDYVNQHTLPQAELKAAADRSSETLGGIETTYDDLTQAKESASDGRLLDAIDYARDAWDAKPDPQSIRDLADMAEQVSPYVDQVEVLTPVYYGGLLAVVDNFASDEIVATLAVMAAAIGLAFVLGRAVGFWVRRGRPGLVARTLQRWGASTFRGWYVRNLPYALSPPLYAAARERMERDIMADPQNALAPEVFRELELYFDGRPREESSS